MKVPDERALSADDPEAKRDEWSEPATRESFTAWLRLPTVTALECVRALRQAGFAIVAYGGGCAELVRQGVRVAVPLATALTPDVLVPILKRAGISPTRFRELLEE